MFTPALNIPYMMSRTLTIYYLLPCTRQILTEARHTVWLGRPLASAQSHIAAVAATSATAAVVGVPVFIVFGWWKAHRWTGRTRQLTVSWNLLQWRFVVHHIPRPLRQHAVVYAYGVRRLEFSWITYVAVDVVYVWFLFVFLSGGVYDARLCAVLNVWASGSVNGAPHHRLCTKIPPRCWAPLHTHMTRRTTQRFGLAVDGRYGGLIGVGNFFLRCICLTMVVILYYVFE